MPDDEMYDQTADLDESDLDENELEDDGVLDPSDTLEGEVGRIADAYTRNPRRHEHAHPP